MMTMYGRRAFQRAGLGLALLPLLSFVAWADRGPLVPEGFVQPPSIHAIESAAHAGTPMGPDGTLPPLPAGRSAYPLVSRDMFGWLPYWEWNGGQILSELQWDLLTHVAYFSVGIDGAGNVTSTQSWSTRGPMLVQAAHTYGVRALLAVTNFSSTEIAGILGSATNRQNAIDNLVALVASAGADGLAIDFEGLPSAQKANMVTFLRDLKAGVQAQVPGGDVWVASPAVDWSGAWDYDLIMDGIDGVFIMGYDYHWSGSTEAGPVGPLTAGSIWGQYCITWTIADYKTFGIARAFRKVTVGLPYYGRYWPTVGTTVPSQATASGTSILYTSAAAEVGAYGRLWDIHSQTPYYLKPGPVQVWYDDAQSLGLKYDTVNAERLGGSGMWALGYDGTLTELWDAIRQKFVRTSLAGLKVGIDPAHGGTDSGAVGPTGLFEKDVTLALALDLRTWLAAEGATVVMTRTTDTDVTEQQRLDALNQAQVDRSICIALGSSGNGATDEVMVSVYGNATAGSLADSRSEAWAAVTAEKLAAFTQLPAATSNIAMSGVVAADEALVRDTEMSSILARPAHITNAAEEQKLRDAAYLCGLAHELYRGLMESYGLAAAPAACQTSTSRPVALAGPGAGTGNVPRVRAFELATGATPQLDIVAYGSMGYGAKEAGADIDGDGRGEILTGPGPGAIYGPQVKAFDGTGVLVPGVSFYAYGTLRYGVNVGAGDVDQGGRDVMLTGAGPGAVFGPHVRGFRRAGNGVATVKNLSFYAYSTLRYGARVAAGALDADGRDEIATAPGPGAVFGPQIRAFDYGTAISAIAKINFWAYSQSGFGAKVALGPIDGDVYAEIVTGRGEVATGAAEVRVYDYDGTGIAPLSNLTYTPLSGTYGVNVAVSDLDSDGRFEGLVGGGPDPSAGARVRAHDLDGTSPVAVPGFDFAAFAATTHGLEVGGGDLGQ